jgi:soluble lytic murein transglycosylase
MKKILVALAFAAVLGAAAVGIFWATADDPEYRAQEIVFSARFGRYDALITQAARRYGVPPELIKAVIWRESRFQPDKTGQHGERGLMQITEGAASDWARAEKIETFVPTDLFDPKVNIEAGAWYLKKALEHWGDKDDPVPFALAEYNAGRTRVKRWVVDSGRGETAGAVDLQTAMDFPGTKSYIAAIVARYEFYARRGEFQ